MSPEPWEGSTPGGHHRAGACSQPGVSPVQTLTVTPNSGSSLDPGTDTRGFPTDATQHSGHSNWAFCSREESVFQTWRASQFWDVPQVVSCSLLQTWGPPHDPGTSLAHGWGALPTHGSEVGMPQAPDLDCVLPLHTCDKWDSEGGEHTLQEGCRCDAPAEAAEGRLS